jgi:purine-nucleoside phosphorylase
MIDWSARAAQAAEAVLTSFAIAPRVGIILGSGLASVADTVDVEARIPTASLPHFPRPTVAGHSGELLLGRMSGRTVAVLSGRVHGYEGYLPSEVAFGVRFLYALGCRELIVTNAAGALNPDFRPGDLMLIDDHVSFPSLAGLSPLVGDTPPPHLTRFVDLTDAYSEELRALAQEVAANAHLSIRHGIYVMVGGPNFETPSEVRFLRLAGGDAVGMSTVPEVIVARQLGMRVLGLSVISNVAAGLPGAVLGHEDVLATVARSAAQVRGIVEGVLARLPE